MVQCSLTDFPRFLAEHLGWTPALGDFTEQAALDYRTALEPGGKKPGRVHTCLTMLQRLANWLVEEEIALTDVLDSLPMPSIRPRELQPFIDEEAQRLYSGCGSVAGRAVLALLVQAGLTKRHRRRWGWKATAQRGGTSG